MPTRTHHTYPMTNQKSSSLRMFLMIFMPLSLLLALLLFSYFLINQNNEIKYSSESEAMIIEMQESYLIQEMQPIIADLQVMTINQELENFVHKQRKKERVALEGEFISFMRQKKVYDQIRLLDDSGNELVRVNYRHGKPQIVPKSSLQAKGSRYYLNDLQKMQPSHLYASPLDLNYEHGKIETPIKPVLRLAKVIISKDTKKKYFLVLNYLGDNLLRKLKRFAANSDSRTMLLNSDGYWILGGQEKNWAFMYSDQVNQSLKLEQPELWAKLHQANTGQTMMEEGLYSYRTIYPLSGGTASGTDSLQSFDNSGQLLTNQEYHWFLISFLAHDTLFETSHPLEKSLVTIFLILDAVILIFSLFYSQSLVNKKLIFNDLKNQTYNYNAVLSNAQDKLFNRTITPRYIIALAFIIVLLLADYASRQIVSKNQETTAAVINVSGRQRMLSQRVALFSLHYARTTQAVQKRKVRIQLQEAINLLKTSHMGLVYGSEKMNLPGYQTEIIRKMYFSPPINLDQQIADYIGSAESLLAYPPGEDLLNHPSLEYILRNGPNRLLSSLDIMVRQYQLNSEANTTAQKLQETTLLIIIIFIIILVAIFIFRPMANKVQVEASKLIRLEQHQRTILGNIQDGLFLVNKQNIIEYCNPKTSEIFLREPSEILGQVFFTLIDESSKQDLSLEEMSHSREYIQQGKRGNGESFPLELLVSDFIFEEQQVYIIVVRDITERNLLHDTLKLKQELEVANQTKDRFLSIIAHDLRSPFNALLHLSRFLLEDIDTQERPALKKDITLLNYSLNNTYALLEQLLLWARTQSSAMVAENANIDFKENLDVVLSQNEMAIQEKGLKLHLDFPEQAVIWADSKMLQTVLHNLLTNAIKFSYPAGNVFIQGEVEEGQMISLTIRDQGVGIPIESQEDLFRLDKNTSTAGTKGEKGSGLGLILCKEIMEKMSGTIEYIKLSEPGTAFTLHFAMPQEEANS